MKIVLRAPHSNQSVEKPRNLCGRLVNFKAELFCSSHLDQHCAPRLVVLGRQWRCLLEEANTDLAPVMRALQRKCHILSRGGVSITHRVSSFPFVLAGPRVADASVMNEQKPVRFEINESKLLMVGLQNTVLWCRSLVSLGFSSSTFWIVKCSCFDGFISLVVFCDLTFLGLQCNSERKAQRRKRVSVSWYALTAVHMPGTRMLGSSWMQHVLLCRSLVSRWFSPSTF